MKTLLAVIFIFITIPVCSQTHEDAENYVKEGIKLVDEGKVDDGIEKIKLALAIEPKNTIFNYELAYAYYKLQKYEKVISILEKVKNNPDSYDIIYSVLGNAYDYTGNRDKAVEIYKSGLKKFPNSGKIYLELGVVEMSEKNYDDALKYFEKGIQVEPTHPSNYYWASVFYAGSNVKLWSLIYGEIFLNMEQNTKRSETISKLMYQVYGESITIKDSAGKKQTNISMNKFNTGKGFDSEYEFTAMFASLSLAVDSTFSGMNLYAINKLRTKFIELWYENEKTKDKHNVLFDFQKMLLDKNMFEAYNYFILAYGNTDEFNKWVKDNPEKSKEFDDWYSNYGMNINTGNALYRKLDK